MIHSWDCIHCCPMKNGILLQEGREKVTIGEATNSACCKAWEKHSVHGFGCGCSVLSEDGGRGGECSLHNLGALYSTVAKGE